MAGCINCIRKAIIMIDHKPKEFRYLHRIDHLCLCHGTWPGYVHAR